MFLADIFLTQKKNQLIQWNDMMVTKILPSAE